MSRTKGVGVGHTNSRYVVRHRRRHRRTSDASHYRLQLEPLEQRRLLTTVTGVDPLPCTHDAPVTTDIWAACDADINPATVSAQTFAVHAMQTGQILESLSVSGDTVTLSPTAPFHPGELVQATLTTGIENLGGDPLADPFVWQFRTAASSGTGLFSDSGQTLGISQIRAVALGDVDGDGDLDAFIGNSDVNQVWLNDGSGNFSDSGQSPGDSNRGSVALGDVDGDGDLDAFIGNSSVNQVWLNDGSGNFSDSGQSLGDSGGEVVELADIDGDGDLDAFVANGGVSWVGQPNKVWLNNGSGTFTDSGQSLGDSPSTAVALGDVDGDGDLDAFVGNGLTEWYTYPNKVWLNDGSGNFSDSGQSLGDSPSTAVALGDVDGDGDLDAFVANAGEFTESNKVWLNDGSGNFSDSGQSLGDFPSTAVALADVDGDGDLDAFVGKSREPNEVWLNDGSGNFSDSGQSLGDSNSRSVALGDVDGDDDLDALVGNWYEPGGVWLNVGIPTDLSVAMTDGQFLVTPGQSLTYTITVANHGPQGASGAIVTDNFPVEISGVSWTGIASAGASCTGSGTGNIRDTITLPVGGTVTYTATGQLSLTASGTITNVATVAAPMELDDVGWANNTATDTDVVPPLDLTPLPGSHTAPVDTNVSATYDEQIDPTTVSVESFAVHGMQTGQILESLSVSGDTITLSPDAPFHAGELVQATTTAGIENLGGEPLVDAFVWQFRTAASSGTGLFSDSGQNLGDSETTAVALGDVDGDGDVDAFTGNKVWLNDGSGTFTDSGQSLVGRSLALGDVDGDGDLDAFVGKSREPNEVWLNDGSGNFSDSGQSLGNAENMAVALGDADGDGDLDAFVGNQFAPNTVWLNDGGGNFTESSHSLGDSGWRTVILGDIDGDGDLDAFGQQVWGPDTVWLNDGSGTFTDSGQSLGDSSSHAVALGDLDADGDLDAFVGNWEGNKVWLNDGSGTFIDSGRSLGDSNTHDVTLGDVDGDGDLDAFVGNSYPTRFNKVWLNDGSGTFTDSGQNLGNAHSSAVALGDVDGDGDLDAFVGNGNAQANKLWLNAGFPADLSVAMTNGQIVAMPGQSVTYTITVTNLGPEDVTGAIVTDNFPAQISDVSWTGIASAGASCTGSGTGNIGDTISLPVGGTVTYTATGQLSPTASGTITNVATVAAPMGLDDIGGANNTARDIDVVLAVNVMPQQGSHTAPVDTNVSATYDEEIDPATVSVATFAVHGMQTGQILESLSVSGNTITLSPDAPFHAGELVQATATAGIENLGGEPLADPFVWQFRTATNGGSGQFSDNGQNLGDSPSTAAALGDVDGDGDLDAFVGSFDEPVKMWLNDGSGTFTDSGQSLGNSLERSVVLGDVDGDGDLDAFIGNTYYSGVEPTTVWLNDGAGSFIDSGQSLGDSNSRAVALGDVDGDGDLDAFIGNADAGPPNTVWLNDGSGTFSDSGQSLGNTRSRAVALGDVDRDGDLDAFVGNWHAPNTVWLNDGSGTFSDSGQSLGDSNTYAVALGDVDGDDDLDALIGNNHSGSCKVWLNDGTGSFSDSGQRLNEDADSGAVALGDVDGDGDLDAYVGNSFDDYLWLNDGSGNFSHSGQYFGSTHTCAVALGDMDRDGDLDVFIANGQPKKVWLNHDPLLGDFDRDFDVDGDDFLIWQAGFGIQMGATRGDGDADSDGDVDGGDFQLWESGFGAGAAAGNACAAPAARTDTPKRFDSFTPPEEAVDEAFAELNRASLEWTKWSLRDGLRNELTLFK